MIRLVTAPPGGGKSYYAVRAAASALAEGKPVAGNLELTSEWPRRIARRDWVYYLRPLRRRQLLRDGSRLYFFSEDLAELAQLRLRGTGEGRGLLILDEAHNWMNARSWSASDRKWIVRLFSQHRKLGWDIILIAQHPEMIDKQVRNLVEYNVHLRNLKKARWGGVPIVPFNVFLAVWLWHSAQRVVVKREVFRLTWRKNLYDTNALSHGLVEGDQGDGATVWLPSPPAERPSAATHATDARPGHGRDVRPPSGGSGDALVDEEASEAGEPESWEPSAPAEWAP